ncbi:hypothetical protein CH63R_11201 [Colletotrichum higginsianum IMI 349063]|uniref:N-acetyltransferase domain-containing protein n=2 Tax=Colletotrichum higginsianum TaxID=80884 RepID=A0A1B7XXK7_COLHI|nr:hypothetical protein CH63R_11201 [Colletotrichum higginsianum IMI 349063]OBR04498.1 hypothetical protein CH63R_11201 [Colletotrichum higginsianum IMI 349063]
MSTTPLETGPMTDDVLRGIFASDQDMYPAPLTWDRLRSWTTAAPDLATCFYLPDNGPSAAAAAAAADTRTIVGAVVALPLLAPAWRDLLAGGIKETDVDAASMLARDYDEGSGVVVGLHVFHVERFDVPEARESGVLRGFGSIAMRAVVAAAEGKGWEVIGHSALTATAAGKRCFEQLGFEPTGYEEFWVADMRGGVELVTVSADTAGDGRVVPDEGTVRGHARMFAKHLPSHPA